MKVKPQHGKNKCSINGGCYDYKVYFPQRIWCAFISWKEKTEDTRGRSCPSVKVVVIAKRTHRSCCPAAYPGTSTSLHAQLLLCFQRTNPSFCHPLVQQMLFKPPPSRSQKEGTEWDSSSPCPPGIYRTVEEMCSKEIHMQMIIWWQLQFLLRRVWWECKVEVLMWPSMPV